MDSIMAIEEDVNPQDLEVPLVCVCLDDIGTVETVYVNIVFISRT